MKEPFLEFPIGSLPFPKEQAMKELGFEDPEELRIQRFAEDIENDPRVVKVITDYLLEKLDAGTD